jgi:hypothetical protein
MENDQKTSTSIAFLALLKLMVLIAFPAIVIYVGTMPYRLTVFALSHFCRSMSTTFARAIFSI